MVTFPWPESWIRLGHEGLLKVYPPGSEKKGFLLWKCCQIEQYYCSNFKVLK